MSRPRPRSRSLSHSQLGLLLAGSLAAVLAAACDDDLAPAGQPGGASGGVAIVSSLFNGSTSVSLYDPATGAVRDDCLHSGLDLAPRLSTDVTLSSQPQLGGELVVIDRGVAALSFVKPADCSVRTQLGVAPDGFNGNPHDLVTLSPTKAYVTRYGRNLNPLTDRDGGEDLLIIDPTAPAVTGRIPLGDRATRTDVEARPDRALLAGGKVYVSLNNLSTDYSATGPGRIVVVDPATDAVTANIDLPDQENCSAMEYVAATKSLWIACGGPPFGTGTATSALVEIDLGAADASGAGPIARVIRADQLGTRPINFGSLAVASGAIFAATLGTVDGSEGDAMFAIPLAGGAPTKIMDSAAFNIGRTTLVPAGTTLLVPDGDENTPRVRKFSIAGGVATAAGDFVANPNGQLPPREAALY